MVVTVCREFRMISSEAKTKILRLLTKEYKRQALAAVSQTGEVNEVNDSLTIYSTSTG